MQARTLVVAVAALTLTLPIGADGQGQRSPATAAAARGTIALQVTDRLGNVLPDVSVTATGPVERSGQTDADGSLTLKTLPPALYRLRFEHDRFITLERDVTVRATTRTEVALSPARPAPSAPPPVAEPPPPVVAPAAPTTAVAPKNVSIPDVVDQNFIGRAPRKDINLGCTPASTTTLLQLREPLGTHAHAGGDEMLYVVAGEGVHTIAGREARIEAGTFCLVPRGTPHSIARRGSNPIVLLSIEAGPACGAPTAAR
jgi:mannose-6-phosphate isomerase-like protein (cupin superfamily)